MHGRALVLAACAAAACSETPSTKDRPAEDAPPPEARAAYDAAVALVAHDADREALAQLREAVRLAPAWDDAWRLLGATASQANDYPTAMEALETLLAREPGDVEAAALLADVCLREGDLPRCARALQLLEQHASGEVRTLVLRARHWLDQGRLDKADVYAQRALRADETQPLAWFIRGLCAEERGDDDEAAQHFQSALRNGPGHLGARSRLAIVLARQGRADEAAQHGEIHAVLSAATIGSYRQRPPEERLSRFGRAVELVPDWGRGSLELGRALLELGRNDEALPVLERAVLLEPGQEAHILLARVLLRKKRYQAADRHAVLSGVSLEAIGE